MAFLQQLGLEHPIVQAGMGGGVSRHELAVAVSDAGGLGTIAVVGAAAIRRELAAARVLTPRPIAVNVLLPIARRDWFEAAAAADVVVTFWGMPIRRTPRIWIHQCGSVREAVAAQRAGADAVIVQGFEAGGHVRGRLPALDLLERTRAALPAGYPLLLAGGIAERADVETALATGACAAVAGTRFLMSPESRAHPAYKQRLLDAEDTMLTELFGFGWPAAPHRVVPNAAIRHQLDADGEERRLNRVINRISSAASRYTPVATQHWLAGHQRPTGRLFTPLPPVDDLPSTLVDSGPLYAGQTIARIHDLVPAADIVATLAG